MPDKDLNLKMFVLSRSVFFGRGKECITQIHVIWKLTNMEELAKRFNCTAVHAKVSISTSLRQFRLRGPCDYEWW